MSKKAKIIYVVLASLAVVEILLLVITPHLFTQSVRSQRSQSSRQLTTAQTQAAGVRAESLMKNLYQWSSDDEYAANKQKIISQDVTAAAVIDQVMPDDQVESQINTANLQSQYLGSQVYQKGKKAGDLTITVRSTVQTGSQETATTFLDTYQAHYDWQKDRFTSLKYQGQVQES